MRKTTTRRKSNANIVDHSNVCSDNEKNKIMSVDMVSLFGAFVWPCHY